MLEGDRQKSWQNYIRLRQFSILKAIIKLPTCFDISKYSAQLPTTTATIIIIAARILITLKSYQVPGTTLSEKEKALVLANKACQQLWGCNFDPNQGNRLTQEGILTFPNQRCYILVDTGPVDSQDYTTILVK